MHILQIPHKPPAPSRANIPPIFPEQRAAASKQKHGACSAQVA
jgi:hypothetical protein